MNKLLLLFLGGGLGTVCRYLLAAWTVRTFKTLFPAGTFVVNMTGCLVIGFLWGLFESGLITPQGRLLLFTGFLGGFTTFSSFMLESLLLFKDREYGYFAENIILSTVAGLLFVYAGLVLSKFILTAMGRHI